MGLEVFGDDNHQMPTTTFVKGFQNIDETVTHEDLVRYLSIEITAGFGLLKGKVWRIVVLAI